MGQPSNNLLTNRNRKHHFLSTSGEVHSNASETFQSLMPRVVRTTKSLFCSITKLLSQFWLFLLRCSVKQTMKYISVINNLRLRRPTLVYLTWDNAETEIRSSQITTMSLLFYISSLTQLLEPITTKVLNQHISPLLWIISTTVTQ